MVCGAGSCQNRVLPGDTLGAELSSSKKWCVPESAGSAIFRATVQPRSLSLAPAAAASVLQNGISTATRTRSTCFVRELRHPHLPAKSSPARPPSSRRAAAPGAGALCPLSGTRGRGAHRAGPWAAARAGAVRMRARAGKWLPARAQFFWRAARPPSGSALQPARGHIYMAQRSTVAVVASARRTPQSTPVRYTCASINCLRVRFLSRIWIAK